MSTDEYLNVDADGKDGTGPAVAAVLESIATTLRDAPENKRYDFELEVSENDRNEEGDS